jgi:S1-C subfamily serine protease
LAIVDWITLAAIALLSLQGWRTGFLGGAFSLVGFALGAVLAARLAPGLLGGGGSSQWAPAIALVGAAFGGAVLASVFERIGSGIRRALPIPFLGTIDRFLGLALGFVTGLFAIWLAAIALLEMPGLDSVKDDLRRSSLVSAIGGVMPSSQSLLGLVSRFDPLPGIGGFTAAGIPAPSGMPGDFPSLSEIRQSVVRVRSIACGFSVEGSGWVASPGLVVTNAHVVAGDDGPTVQPLGVEPGLSAKVTVFDRVNDIAILRVSGLSQPPLSEALAVNPGQTAAALGFPLNGGFRIEPVSLGRTLDALTPDAYASREVQRRVVVLRGRIRPGNSGGPVIDSSGRVAATVYGRTVGGGPEGGFAVPSEVVHSDLQKALSGQSNRVGPCTG